MQAGWAWRRELEQARARAALQRAFEATDGDGIAVVARLAANADEESLAALAALSVGDDLEVRTIARTALDVALTRRRPRLRTG